MSSNFRYQLFVAVSGNLGEKVPVVDNVWSFHEHEIYPTTSLDKNCRELKFQTDRNFYVDLKHMYLAPKLRNVNCRCYATYNKNEIEREQQEEAKADEETAAPAAAEEKQEVPVPLVTHANNILQSIFSNVAVCINNQQNCNTKGLYADQSYVYNNFKGAISEYKVVLHCRV